MTHSRAPLGSARLRAYLMLYGLFFDKLITGDSQFINNQHLRSLIWKGEGDGDPSVLADLSLLLGHGVLTPVLRGGAPSLHSVWQDLTSRGVPEAGSEGYVKFVQENLTDQKLITYKASAVSSLFRDQVLATFSPENEKLRLKESVRQAVSNYVTEQEPLYYIKLRQWMEDELDAGRMTEYHRRKVDLAVGAAYRHNVPKSIQHCLIDVPIDPDKFWTPIDVNLGLPRHPSVIIPSIETRYIRPFCVSPAVLGKLRAETLLAIRDEPSRQPVIHGIERFRLSSWVDVDKFAGDLERYLLRAEEISYHDASGSLRDYIRARRRSARQARLTVVRDMTLAAAGLGIWDAAVSNIAGYAGLVVTAWASIDSLRRHRRDGEHLDGYAIGRAIGPEHRLLLDAQDPPVK